MSVSLDTSRVKPIQPIYKLQNHLKKDKEDKNDKFNDTLKRQKESPK